MNILITGAGLIGCHGARLLLDKGCRVVLYDVSPDHGYIRSVVGDAQGLALESGDLRDLPALVAAVRKHRIEIVVHTAGLIGKKAAEHPSTGFAVNVQGTFHVAEAVRLMQVRRLVFLSSFGVYNREIPSDKAVAEDFPLSGGGFYGATKAANEHILGAMADLAGFELIILRPAGVFGPGHYRGGSTVGMAVNELMEGVKSGKPVRLKETLLGTNEYVYVKDVAQAVEKACTASAVKNRAYNVGTGVLSTAQELMQCLRELVPGANVELIPAGPGEALKNRAQPLDLSRIRSDLGYKPAYSLKTGLADYLKAPIP